MKSILSKSLVLVALIVFLTACKSGKLVVLKSKPSPGKSSTAPGQVKKATGSKSAKPFAPGQQKKKN
jgi:hypothetical protein